MTGIVIVAVLVFVSIPSILYLSVSKRKSPVTLGFILAGIHLVFVLWIASVDHHYANEWSSLLWYWVYFLDMPISLPFFSVLRSLDPSGWAENLFYLAYFGVLGSTQYFLLGLLLARLFLFARKH